MKIININTTDENEIIREAVKCLTSGNILIYPTETTYGMGVDAENLIAVEKLLSFKEKREGKPLSVAVNNISLAKKYVEINSAAKNIYENFLPGPVTVISKSLNKVAPFVASEKNTLGIRIPDYPLILKIIEKFGRGVTATSANASGGKRPYKISDVLDDISQKQKDLISLILDAGELPHNNPSTVIDTVSGEINTIRFGDKRFDLNQNIISKSESETVEFGKSLGKYLKTKLTNPVVIAIQGDLGAGKTHFASGLGSALGINDLIKSPTFSLMNEYKFQENKYFYHIDTYRMENEEDLLFLGYEKMLSQPNIILIEWADRVIPVLDKYKTGIDFIWLRFEYIDENTRNIFFNGEEVKF